MVNRLSIILDTDDAVDGSKRPIRIDSPSQRDHHAWQAEVNRVLNSAAYINAFAGAMGLNILHHNSSDVQAQRQNALALPRNLGTVSCMTSGMLRTASLPNNCRLDWAMLSLTRLRFPQGSTSLSNVSEQYHTESRSAPLSFALPC